jgi:signal transduction histidine kinase
MKIGDFLQDKLIFIAAAIFTAAFGALIMSALECPAILVLLTAMTYILGSAVSLLAEYIKKRIYYKTLFAQLDELGRKHFISEIMEEPDFLDGTLWAQALRTAAKSMNNEISALAKVGREYCEYVELWVHEIKTPISGAKLICENKGYDSLGAELNKIELCVEQALFYARSRSVEKDYMLRETDLAKTIREAVKNSAVLLIAKRVNVEIAADGNVVADGKWLEFILRQLLDNAVKYGAKNIIFRFENNALTVCDDGIGIPPEDITRVFERGFTGINGRQTAKTTGMGLYICRELCGKLGLDISLLSDGRGKGTVVEIRFPQNAFVKF